MSKKAFTYGWISPEGELYPCGYMEHTFQAAHIIASKYHVRNLPYMDRDRFLEERGWLRVGNKMYANSIFNPNGVGMIRVPTKKQISVLQELGLYDDDVEQWIFELEMMRRDRAGCYAKETP